MYKTAIGIEVISKIILQKEIDSDEATEILIDIEDRISEYMKEKYGAIAGGSGKLIYKNEC